MASTQQESDPAVSNEAYELYSGSNGERDNVNLWTGPEPEQATRAYPRADGGKEAWLFLGSCFMFEAFVWGESDRSRFKFRKKDCLKTLK